LQRASDTPGSASRRTRRARATASGARHSTNTYRRRSRRAAAASRSRSAARRNVASATTPRPLPSAASASVTSAPYTLARATGAGRSGVASPRVDLRRDARQPLDLAADAGAVARVERDEDVDRRVVRGRGVGGDEAPRQIRALERFQIHREEGDLGGDVDAAEGE